MTATHLHLILAALFGAAGVAALAAGAHLAGSNMTTAGQILLFHASALIAGATARKAGLLHGRIAQFGLAALALGAALFAADLALRALWEARLFAMAAPTGGTMMIAGWIALGIAALAAPRATGS